MTASTNKDVDNDDSVARPDTLVMFLNSVMPSRSIIETNRKNSVTDAHRPRLTRKKVNNYIRSPAYIHAWLDAQNQMEREQAERSPLWFTHVNNRQEIYLGRWLHTRYFEPTVPRVRPPIVKISGRVIDPNKRYRPGPFGEVRLPLPFATPNLNSPRTTNPSPPRRVENTTSRSSNGIGNIELFPVGGVARILCHASAYVAPRTYVFGGLTKFGCTDRMWSLLPAESGWRSVQPVGDYKPSSRYGHTLVAWRKYLVLFGGDGGPGYFDDLWYFDTESKAWDRISLEQEQEGRRPGARTGHSAVVHNDQMLIFGGWRGGDGFADVWSYDLEARNWDLLHYKAGQGRELERTANEGVLCPTEIPEPRQWHVCGVFGEYMYIHGGYGFGGVLRHVWRFHIATRTWEFVPTKGSEPAARCRHSGVVVGIDKWVLFGGKDAEGSYFCDMFIMDIRTHTWWTIALCIPPPISNGRKEWWNSADMMDGLPYLHCQATAYDYENKCIVISGGCHGESAAYDSTILIKRYCAASLLFEEWISRRPLRISEPTTMDLPEFLHRHPEPAAREILRFL